ncbi:hypothetical protein CEXT_426031 [Caerostris extrusa]|uniref:Uncharacterized protein n=1 Tax=Caerostris extrusa TaxID=172846 RepID=A0AAV4P128_CAEEX|nr:hypothetical protein CEXT_426031 [Caerostris extrusa]
MNKGTCQISNSEPTCVLKLRSRELRTAERTPPTEKTVRGEPLPLEPPKLWGERSERLGGREGVARRLMPAIVNAGLHDCGGRDRHTQWPLRLCLTGRVVSGGHLWATGRRPPRSNHAKCGRPNYLLSEEEPLVL